MLNALRKSVRSIFFKIFFAVLIASFAIWGIEDVFRGGGDERVAAEVGDIKIPTQTLFANLRNRMRQLDVNMTAEQARSLGVVDATLENLITTALYDAEAHNLGMVVPDDTVGAHIREMPVFENEAGTFDRFVFDRVLDLSGLTEPAFVEQLRREILRQQLLSSVVTGAKAPRLTAERLYRWREEQRVAEVIALPLHDAVGIEAPDESALAAHHEENAATFTAPEYRGATIIHLTTADLVPEIEVSEDRLREAYEERQAEFAVPERRTVQQMVFSDKAEAEAAVARLREGAAFEAVAREAAQQDPATTSLGAVTRQDLPDALAGAAFAMEAGTVSEALEGPFGWHVLKVTDIAPGQVRPFEDVRARLKQDIAQHQAVDTLYDLANAVEDALGSGATLEEAAERVDVALHRIAAVDRRRQGRDGSPVADLPPGQRFLDALFETPRGEESFLTETENGGYFVLRVDSVEPSALRPLAEVRDEVAAAWTRERQQEKTMAQAEALAVRIGSGESPASVAQSAGLELVVSAPFHRDGRGIAGRMPNALVSDMFAARPGEAAAAELAGGGAAVSVLKEVRPAASEGADAAIARTREQMVDGLRSDLIVQYNDALRSQFDVTKNWAAIDAIIGQGAF